MVEHDPMKLTSVVIILATLAICSSSSALGADGKTTTYEDDVLPIFRNSCFAVITPTKPRATWSSPTSPTP